ncbi:hypothetical protein NQZ68_035105 [Dissostichus eleginoides]|nr:hypothetical protein NQZ68_035105 [Dissostichus eleginoides]
MHGRLRIISLEIIEDDAVYWRRVRVDISADIKVISEGRSVRTDVWTDVEPNGCFICRDISVYRGSDPRWKPLRQRVSSAGRQANWCLPSEHQQQTEDEDIKRSLNVLRKVLDETNLPKMCTFHVGVNRNGDGRPAAVLVA